MYLKQWSLENIHIWGTMDNKLLGENNKLLVYFMFQKKLGCTSLLGIGFITGLIVIHGILGIKCICATLFNHSGLKQYSYMAMLVSIWYVRPKHICNTKSNCFGILVLQWLNELLFPLQMIKCLFFHKGLKIFFRQCQE